MKNIFLAGIIIKSDVLNDYIYKIILPQNLYDFWKKQIIGQISDGLWENSGYYENIFSTHRYNKHYKNYFKVDNNLKVESGSSIKFLTTQKYSVGQTATQIFKRVPTYNSFIRGLGDKLIQQFAQEYNVSVDEYKNLAKQTFEAVFNTPAEIIERGK